MRVCVHRLIFCLIPQATVIQLTTHDNKAISIKRKEERPTIVSHDSNTIQEILWRQMSLQRVDKSPCHFICSAVMGNHRQSCWKQPVVGSWLADWTHTKRDKTKQ